MNALLIGYGAIGRHIVKSLRPGEAAQVGTILVRPQRVAETQAAVGAAIAVVSTLGDALAQKPDVAVECAGHQAVSQFGPEVLARGIDLMVISIGALADRALFEKLKAAAERGKAKLLLPAGAIAGVDGLAAARQGGLDRVRYTSRKPPKAWKGTPGEKVADLDALTVATVLFQGRADDAARLYPQNANVAATVALSGAGFDKTEVALIADPAAGGNVHQIEAEGAFGRFSIELRGKPLPDNPKTSSLTAFSLLRAIRNRAEAVEI
ncbi:MAG: aspartate dehydrogenase [Alphaproteobacteria bacterium]